MELRLGLALPTYESLKALDLNKEESEPWIVGCSNHHGCSTNYCTNHKRSFRETGELNDKKDDVFHLQTLPLLQLWSSSHPDEEDDDAKRPKKRSLSCSIKHTAIHKKNDEEDSDQYVGWPPIKSRRKKAAGGGSQHQIESKISTNGGSSSLYVKVKMEGVVIARKLDLSLYHSYHTLTAASVAMFSKHEKRGKNGASFALTYQDSEGDWLLAGDLPWQAFVETVQRLKIVKKHG